MKQLHRHCYWSIATGEYEGLMADCVQSARRAGIREEFHVFANETIPDCVTHQAYDVSLESGFFKLIYLKGAVSSLDFDYYIWVDADTTFQSRPISLLANLALSPIHVPLWEKIQDCPEGVVSGDISNQTYYEHMRNVGVTGNVYFATSAFWIVSSKAVESVFNLAMGFWHSGKSKGFNFPVDSALTYAMQMLCANSKRHEVSNLAPYWGCEWVVKEIPRQGFDVNKVPIRHLSRRKTAISRHCRENLVRVESPR